MSYKLFRFLAICTIGVAAATSSIAWAQSITTFDAPGAGTGPGQGTVTGQKLQSLGTITGYYVDAGGVAHGYVRIGTTFTSFDAPGAGGFGTLAFGINQNGAVTGYYQDAAGSGHSYLRSSGGTFTRFDVLDALKNFALSLNPPGATSGVYRDTHHLAHRLVPTAPAPMP